jgi:RNA polymerase sigma factor (sigma-70 family)
MSNEREPGSEHATDFGGISDEEAGRLWAEFLEGANPHALSAFERLYQHFLPVVFRYCRSCMRDIHTAEDMANTVFVRLLETRPLLRSSFVGLLLGTARNLCATELGKRKPVDDAPIPTQHEATEEVELRDTWVALADCLARLPERDQTLVILRHGQGLTFRQIRDVLGTRAVISTLTRRLTSVMAKLQACLKEKNIF